MKKKKFLWSIVTIILVAMLSSGFASCSGNDDNEGGGDNSLIGRWALYFYEDEEESYVVPTNSSEYEEIEFTADGYKVYGFYNNNSFLRESGTWKLDDDRLYINSHTFSDLGYVTIKSLSKSKLVIILDGGEIETYIKGSRIK